MCRNVSLWHCGKISLNFDLNGPWPRPEKYQDYTDAVPTKKTLKRSLHQANALRIISPCIDDTIIVHLQTLIIKMFFVSNHNYLLKKSAWSKIREDEIKNTSASFLRESKGQKFHTIFLVTSHKNRVLIKALNRIKQPYVLLLLHNSSPRGCRALQQSVWMKNQIR